MTETCKTCRWWKESEMDEGGILFVLCVIVLALGLLNELVNLAL